MTILKMHYRKDTNCISLSSNGNVSICYGRGYYKDRYIMVKVAKRDFGEKDNKCRTIYARRSRKANK